MPTDIFPFLNGCDTEVIRLLYGSILQVVFTYLRKDFDFSSFSYTFAAYG